jgi:hypothetical protein
LYIFILYCCFLDIDVLFNAVVDEITRTDHIPEELKLRREGVLLLSPEKGPAIGSFVHESGTRQVSPGFSDPRGSSHKKVYAGSSGYQKGQMMNPDRV